MTIDVRAYANADDVLIAWRPAVWSDDWAGFQIERRDRITGAVTVLNNRIPPKAGQAPVGPSGISSAVSPIRRCLWTDHSVQATEEVSYRVTAMVEQGGRFKPDTASTTDWTPPLVTTGEAGNGLSAFFNRGTLMSQIVSRFVKGDVSEASLRAFKENLEKPGFAARRYLSGHARHEILTFLADADRRGSSIFAAIYEIGDRELVEALKPFGQRGHILIGNGGGTADWVAGELEAAGLDVRHRDLSKAGRSSPSVHNKFVVEADAKEEATRVLTGSTNWTTTGLCTQLNNVLIAERPAVAARFLTQWHALVKAGDNLPPALKTANGKPTIDREITVLFAATRNEAEFAPILDLIRQAKQACLFLMFMPGQSPLLSALLDRAKEDAVYVRGVVSQVRASEEGDIAQVGGTVVKSGNAPQDFHRDILLPAGVTERGRPSWAEAEFNIREMMSAHIMAIVHSKVIVIDPFSDDCAVVTGSHNFSVSASAKNDENLVIIRGNKALAQAYALHINGVYDHYSWRVFLAHGGKSDQLYKALEGWKPGGSRARELDFWMA
jgi:phosphatidylserine/phosphatidylglycerophosphate/cardiolipin synthase-like enzyme